MMNSEWNGNVIKILFEDDNIIIIAKPAGMLVHSDSLEKREKTVVDWILDNYPELKQMGEQQKVRTGELVDRPGIVHRIDRDTSGVLIIAKTAHVYNSLKIAFKQRDIKKHYKALTYSLFKEEKGVIDFAIGKSVQDIRKRVAGKYVKGKVRDAITEFAIISDAPLTKQVLNLFSRPNKSASINGVTLVDVFPLSGRTHQIRAHFTAIGHPLVNDTLYAPSHPRLKCINRMMLHAFSITIPGYVCGKEVTVFCDIPPDMKYALTQLGLNEKGGM